MNEMPNRNGVFTRARLRLGKIPWPILIIFWAIALGIGTNAGVFTVGAVVFPYWPYPHPEQLVVLRPNLPDGGKAMSAKDFLDLRRHTTVFQDLNASASRVFRLNTPAGPQEITASLVTAGFFQMMGDRFALGYDFDPADGTAGSERVAVLSHAMWEQLGGHKFVVGSTVSMDKTPYTVVGVLAPGLRDRGAPVTVPLILSPQRCILDHQRMSMIGRLKPRISIPEAQADIGMALVRISRTDLNLVVEPVNSTSLRNDRKSTMWLLLGVVMFILLMHSVSVAGLFRLRSDAALKRDLEAPGGFRL